MAGVHCGVVLFPVLVVNFVIVRVLDDVRNVVESPVGNGGAKVGKMQGSASQLSLSYGKGNDGQGLPASLAVAFVVISGIRHEAPEFGREVAAQFLPETERLHIVVPGVHSFGNSPVFRIVQYVPQHIAIVGVAGHHYGFLQVER